MQLLFYYFLILWRRSPTKVVKKEKLILTYRTIFKVGREQRKDLKIAGLVFSMWNNSNTVMQVWKLIITKNDLAKFEVLKIPYEKFTKDNLDKMVD